MQGTSTIINWTPKLDEKLRELYSKHYVEGQNGHWQLISNEINEAFPELNVSRTQLVSRCFHYLTPKADRTPNYCYSQNRGKAPRQARLVLPEQNQPTTIPNSQTTTNNEQDIPPLFSIEYLLNRPVTNPQTSTDDGQEIPPLFSIEHLLNK